MTTNVEETRGDDAYKDDDDDKDDTPIRLTRECPGMSHADFYETLTISST